MVPVGQEPRDRTAPHARAVKALVDLGCVRGAEEELERRDHGRDPEQVLCCFQVVEVVRRQLETGLKATLDVIYRSGGEPYSLFRREELYPGGA
jgi:hypothetical protein